MPTAARASAPSGTFVILDGSLSMELPSDDGTRWDDALQRARQVSGASQFLLMGAESRTIPRDSLEQLRPGAGRSLLLPALQAAGESGADKVVLITDGGIEDLQEVRRWLPRLGLTLESQTVGAETALDRRVSEVNAPAWAEAAKPIKVRIGVTANAASTTPARISIRANNATLVTGEVPAADAGRVAMTELEFTPTPPPGGGLVRFDVVLEPNDAFAPDNTRSFYVYVGDEPAGVALVSFTPDWEPRFLHPILEQALGLPMRSFLRASGSSFVTGGPGTEAGKRVTEEEAREATNEASLLVLHGVGPDLPAWAREAMENKARTLIFPRTVGVELPGLSVPTETPGDWYISGEVPASPIAGLLAGIDADQLTPLLAVQLPRDLPANSWTPLYATRGRRGAQTPIVAVTSEGNRRRAVVLGSGFWRWAFRGGAQRAAYNRLWAALTSWLAQEQITIAGGAVRPVSRAVERGVPLAWIAPGLAADSIRVRIFDGARIVADSAIPVTQGDTAFSRALLPGHYRYEATAFVNNRAGGSGAGPITVETYSAEYARDARPLTDLASVASQRGGGRGGMGARPLRTTVWPYLLVTLLLASEWVLRRRWGLR